MYVAMYTPTFEPLGEQYTAMYTPTFEPLGESLTAAEELYRYRNWLIAAKTAARAGNQIDAQKALAEAEKYRRMYLSRGDADLTKLDRIVLAVGQVPGAVGAGIAQGLKPLLPYLLLAVAGLYLWKRD